MAPVFLPRSTVLILLTATSGDSFSAQPTSFLSRQLWLTKRCSRTGPLDVPVDSISESSGVDTTGIHGIGVECRLRLRAQVGRSYESPINEQQQQQHVSPMSEPESDRYNAGLHKTKARSQIREIRSQHLAGVVNSQQNNNDGSINASDGVVAIPFSDHQNFVAVTGETASGKSLLVARVVELLTGGKAASSFLAPGHTSAKVEIELSLRDPYLAAAELVFKQLDLDASSLIPTIDHEVNRTGRLFLSRTLQSQPPNLLSPTLNNTNGKSKLKSICLVNDQLISLKALAALASPLLTVVDAPTAASALSKASTRTAVLDTAVPTQYISRVSGARKNYRECRRLRQKLENELSSRLLPRSYSVTSLNKDDTELLSHWVDELDAFERRIEKFCQTIAANTGNGDTEDSMSNIKRRFSNTSWRSNDSTGSTFVSAMFTLLSDLRDALQSLDDQIVSTRNAAEILGSLALPNSVATAIERARKLIFASSIGKDPTLESAAEKSHELLNEVESALNSCTKFLEDNENGMLSILEGTRGEWLVSVEAIEEIFFEWKSLARKHGVSPVSLPSCHMALVGERDGNVETREVLPKAKADEIVALAVLKEASSTLTFERRKAAKSLADAVTRQMPSLGMVDTHFCVNITNHGEYTGDNIETAEFILVRTSDTNRKGALVNDVASSGEKARILLAIECALPGAIGVACSNNAIDDSLWGELPPIAVVYDEIDAHVGGRAAVSMANLLIDQSRCSQVIAITHSPSVAAAADMHVVIQKGTTSATSMGQVTIPVTANVVNERDRLLELARMASGDLAAKEAEAFAGALIRDGLTRRNVRSID